MKVTRSWLREFTPVGLDADALGDVLSDLGLAVESATAVGEGLDGVVVARVLALRPHPGADRIQLVDVDAGDGEALQIACGAFNMAVGDLVPLATVGAVLPGGVEIGKRKLRGEWSNGMLCSAVELRTGDDHGGIWLLPDGLVVGTPLRDALGIEPDVLYDLEVNPNRPDAMSVAGVARDVAARLGLPFTVPTAPVAAAAPWSTLERTTVEVEATDVCGRFVARLVGDVRVAPSPPWLARRLALCGMRPINNVVDASNYVMLELGQPNHAYDLRRLGGAGLRVRRARAGEVLVTLDDVERALVIDDLLICDGDDRPVGLAGIMGGAAAEIDATTTDVLLEAAWFDPMTIARTAGRLGLRTEASARFERGADWEAIEPAVARFGQLLEAAGAWVAPDAHDVAGQLPDRAPVRLRVRRVNALLGTDLSGDDVRAALDPLGFRTTPGADGDLQVALPSFRLDTATEVDLVEEVARLHGYSRIAPTVPRSARPGALSDHQRRRRALREVLLGLGYDEALPTSLVAQADLDRTGLVGATVALANPMSSDESLLRPSLRPGLLRAVAHNAAHREVGVHLFEVGRTFLPPTDGSELPHEVEQLAAVAAGDDALEARAVWDVVADALGVEGAVVVTAEEPGLHPTRTAALVGADGSRLGTIGEISPEVAEAWGIGERVAWLELDVARLVAAGTAERVVHPVSRQPSSDVDLAFVVDDGVAAGDVEAALRTAAGELLVRVELFDVFRSEALGAGRRSLAYRLRLQSATRTLTDDDVAAVRERCIEAVAAIGATLRG